MMEKFCNKIFGPKKYVSVEYTQTTQRNLIDYCCEWGLDYKAPTKSGWKPSKFHTTLMYSTTRHRGIPDQTLLLRGKAEPIGFDMFGEDKDCLVIKLKSPHLHEAREYLEVQLGMKCNYPIYRPHITLCYNYKGAMPNELPQFPLLYDKFIIKDQEND